MVEMALVTPLIVFILFGFTDVGRAYYQYTTLTQATREGARYAAVGWSVSGASSNSNLANAPFSSVQGRIQYVGNTAGLKFLNDATHILITYYDTTVTPEVQCAHWDWATNTVVLEPGYTVQHPRSGDLVKVRVNFAFTTLTPILSQITGSVFNLNSVAEMRIE
jgi:Flp pilus assembly protein TadG